MDRFDDIWKNRFNEEPAPIDDWNTPDDLVWDAISMEVPRKEERRKWWILWLGLGLLISLGLAVWVYNDITAGNGQDNAAVFEELGTFISDLSEKELPVNIKKNLVPLTSSTISVDPKEIVTPKKAVAPKQTNKIKEERTEKQKSVSQTSSTPTKSTKESKESISTPTNSNSNTTTIKESSNGETSLLKSSTQNAKSDARVSLKSPESGAILPVSSFAFINTLPIAPLEVLEPTNKQHLSPVPEAATKKPSKNLALALNSGAMYWQHRISDTYTSDLSAFDFNYSDDFGWQGSVQLHWMFHKRISLISGLQYENVQISSGHNSALTYNPKAENAIANNDYSIDLATPYGLAGANFRFNRTEEIGEEEVDLLVDFHSAHRIQNWSLPILLQINPLGQNRRFSPLLTIGGGVNYLSAIKNNIQSIDTHHDAIQFEQDAVGNDFAAPSTEKWHFDYRLGAGFQYQLNPRLQIQMNYQWARGINPVFEQQTYKTNIDRHQLSLGLVKKI
ncbi:MAG: hypothetical protein AB8F74_10925 [Saprospiraceae bacterium]